jgi:nucleotide-binding universal stress UspA family protein
MHDIAALAGDYRQWRSNVAYAAGLAAMLKGSLTGVYVSPLPMPVPNVASPVLASEIIDTCREQAEEASRAQTAFAEWAAGKGVGSSAWHVGRGDVLDVLGAAANWHDAVVLERESDAPWTTLSAIAQTLLRVDVPCVIVPAGIEVARTARIAVAWNGSTESVRALHAALPLLQRAADVVLIGNRCRDSLAGASFGAAPNIVEYLAAKGLQATCIGIDADGTGAAILDAASRARADLLVMGAYGRTRVGEWLLGGVSRHVLQHATIPLFMRH